MPFSSEATGIPSRNTIRLPGWDGTRSPGVMIPTRFSGSQAETTSNVPVAGARCASRRATTASGNANCSPTKPDTNRPPRISPLASRRRYTRTRSRQRGAIRSLAINSGKTTPYRWSSCMALASSGSSTGSRASSRDHRPALTWRCERGRWDAGGWLALVWVRRVSDSRFALRRERLRSGRPRFGFPPIRARSGTTLSDVTNPLATSIHSASSTSDGRRRVRAIKSLWKQAPRLDRISSISAAAPLRLLALSGAGSNSQSRDSRSDMVMPEARVRGAERGTAPTVDAELLPPDKRPQTTSPPVHRRSSSSGP